MRAAPVLNLSSSDGEKRSGAASASRRRAPPPSPLRSEPRIALALCAPRRAPPVTICLVDLRRLAESRARRPPPLPPATRLCPATPLPLSPLLYRPDRPAEGRPSFANGFLARPASHRPPHTPPPAEMQTQSNVSRSCRSCGGGHHPTVARDLTGTELTVANATAMGPASSDRTPPRQGPGRHHSTV